MAWLNEHYRILSLIVSTLTLLVWVFYAHLLLSNYRRQRRPKILINQSLGHDLDSHCLICNMSEEAIYVALMVAELHTAEGDWHCEVTDLAPDAESVRSTLDQTIQGPLRAGEFQDIGCFRTMVNRVLRSRGMAALDVSQRAPVELRQLVVYLLCVYVSEDSPVGASRTFDLIPRPTGYELKPASVDTERLSSLKERKKVREWLRRYL